MATLEPAVTRACREITKRHSSTFYLGSLLLDPPRRAAVWAVYAVCRLADEIADAPGPEAAARLEQLERWQTELRAALAGRPAAQAHWQALAWSAERFALPADAFDELHAGLLSDIVGDEITNLGALELYCRRVAGVVGLLVAPICGYSGGQDTLERAVRLGQAMQLTNILRDVGDDLRLGRVYLPSELMARYGLDRAGLARGRVTPSYRALIQELERLARRWYAEAEPGLVRLHPRARLAIGVAARAYAGILDALVANGYDNLSKRAFVSNRRKLALVPGALWRYGAGLPRSRALEASSAAVRR